MAHNFDTFCDPALRLPAILAVAFWDVLPGFSHGCIGKLCQDREVVGSDMRQTFEADQREAGIMKDMIQRPAQ